MSSRRFSQCISIEIHQIVDGVGGFVRLTKRRAFIDMQALLIEVIGDPTTEALDHNSTRIVWHRPSGDKVLNLSAIFVIDGRRRRVQFQAVSELFENAAANPSRLTDIDGVEAIFVT